MSALISSAASCHSLASPASPRARAACAPRCAADQHMSFENVKCLTCPRTSQMLQSGSRQHFTPPSPSDAPVGSPSLFQRAPPLPLDHRPHPVVQPLPAAQPDLDGLENGAPHVVLRLRVGRVPGPDRPRALVTGQMVEDLLGEIPLAVHAVDDLELVVALGEIGEEPEEIIGLPVEAKRVEAPEREARVAEPAVPVIPVALPAGFLR